MPHDRPFDVILYGVTGYTGSLSAKYIAQQYGKANPATSNTTGGTNQNGAPSSASQQLRFAFASRNASKIKVLIKVLSTELNQPEILDTPVLTADTADYDSMLRLTSQAKVIVSYVGPYLIHGENVVKACIESGTHYCDITGGFPFVKEMLQKYNDAANEKKLKIVSHCGFGCVPSDLGTFLLQEHAISRFGSPCQSVRFRLTELRLGNTFSGGTIYSIKNMAPALPDAISLEQPYYVVGKRGEGDVPELHANTNRILDTYHPF